MDNTSIVASGTKFDIGCRVILWDEKDGMSFYPRKLFYARDISFNDLQKEITCFVLHHSVTYRAKDTYTGLLGRGLSVNFIIDDDIRDDGFATIYQCADVKDACWSHGPLNKAGAGVEICYHPEYWIDNTLYSDQNISKHSCQTHDIVDDIVFGAKKKVYAPTEAQIKSCIKLMWGQSELFPYITPEFPKDVDGYIARYVVDNKKGFLLHQQISNQKTDPSGMPLERIEKEIIDLKKQYDKKPLTLSSAFLTFKKMATSIISK